MVLKNSGISLILDCLNSRIAQPIRTAVMSEIYQVYLAGNVMTTNVDKGIKTRKKPSINESVTPPTL